MRHFRENWKELLALSIVLAIGFSLRIIDIANAPGREWDEFVYYAVSHNLLTQGLLETKNHILNPNEPYLYQPPFHFLFQYVFLAIFGDNFTNARVFATLCSTLLLIAVFYLLYNEWGRAALIPVAFLAIDTWIVYTGRVAWIDNDDVVLATIAVIIYAKTLTQPTSKWFILAGISMGFAVIYKQVGAYLVIFTFLMYVLRPQKNHSGHLLLLICFLIVISAYALGMLLKFNDFWLAENFAQTQRAVSGTGETRGTINSFGQTLQAFSHQYIIFFQMILLTGSGVFLLGCETVLLIVTAIAKKWPIRSQRLAFFMQKFWGYTQGQENPPNIAFAQDTLVFYCWSMGFVVFIGLLGIKFPNYFILGLVPIFIYTLLVAVKFMRLPAMEGSRRWLLQAILATFMLILLLSNGLSYYLRFDVSYGDALKDSSAYLDAHVKNGELVITEESIGVMIQKPYCKLDEIGLCPSFSWIVVYVSNTQQPPKNACVKAALSPINSVKMASFYGFKESKSVNGGVFVYKLRKASTCQTLTTK